MLLETEEFLNEAKDAARKMVAAIDVPVGVFITAGALIFSFGIKHGLNREQLHDLLDCLIDGTEKQPINKRSE